VAGCSCGGFTGFGGGHGWCFPFSSRYSSTNSEFGRNMPEMGLCVKLIWWRLRYVYRP
jgi:hypothetical protein